MYWQIIGFVLYGGGYVDHGTDIFDDENDVIENKNEEKIRKVKKSESVPKKGGINNYFSSTSHIRSKVKNDAEVKLDDEDLKNILTDLDNSDISLAPPPIFPRKVKVMKLSTTPNNTPLRQARIDLPKQEAELEQTEVDESLPEPVLKLETQKNEDPKRFLTPAEWDAEQKCDEQCVDVTGSEAFFLKEDNQLMIRMYWLDAFEDPVKNAAVFNTTTTAMERLLVEKGMMGPGWIDIINFCRFKCTLADVNAPQTFCEYEFTVDMEKMKNISYNPNLTQNPPLVRMLAINIITTLNNKKENEICMISTLFNPVCDLNNPSTDQRHLQRLCLVTKPFGGILPFDLKEYVKLHGLADIISTASNEKALLSLFLAKIQKYEPDILVGHDLTSAINMLISRLDKLKVVNWSRTSRLRRTVNISKLSNSKAGQWELTAGRMLVDSRLSAMELVRSRSYDLSELSMQLLGQVRENIYANEVTAKFNSSQQLMNLIMWSWMDPWLALRVIVHINALPLAVQITNIVGGVMSFKKSNCKEKRGIKYGEEGENIGCEEGTDNVKTKHKVVLSILDGIVQANCFISKCFKGLYDTLILLLDFNSLYPSIIQEYNICFTTVRHKKDGDDLPEVPSSEFKEGILPREIRGLVERRKQVKRLMKDAPELKKNQYDIRQMALKLTANSMYGCLGFQQSRFYAKPLAALVTSKGREILMHTKELVEKLGYAVIYGDTDSIMINTNSSDLKQAKKLGFEIKKQVNQCHRLLELELDAVFKRMLLLKKKKYAALTVNLDHPTDIKKELKGLDIVRRDWSQLAKEAGRFLLKNNVYQFLHKISHHSRIIFQQLTRNPRDYHDLKSQPHATVAIRLNESGKFTLHQGDIVEYIICEVVSFNL
uniref:DNA polymerase n=1 Tax=Heterorhabditis bacteriophora TaxID=37862 RepID=A0A1I7XQC9_HETBA